MQQILCFEIIQSNLVTENLDLKWRNTPPKSFDRTGGGAAWKDKTKWLTW